MHFRIKLTVLLIALINTFNAHSTNSTSPNIVIIFTDDQGYADVGVFGAKGFSTPNIDRIAEEGMRFTDFYVASSVCSPSSL